MVACTMTMSTKTAYTPLDQEEGDLVVVDYQEQDEPTTMPVSQDDVSPPPHPRLHRALELPIEEQDHAHAQTVGAGVASATFGL